MGAQTRSTLQPHRMLVNSLLRAVAWSRARMLVVTHWLDV